MKGRKPKPQGMSARNARRADTPPVGLPECPPHLQGEARDEWERISARLLQWGLVTEIDGAALALYCQAWARWVDAEVKLARFGTVVSAPSGFPVQSPYLAVANKAMDQMARLLVEFGMSPSSRSRVKATPRPAPQRTVHIAEGEDPRRLLRSVK